jgi:hypothetical protein
MSVYAFILALPCSTLLITSKRLKTTSTGLAKHARVVLSGDAKIFIHSENLKPSSLRRRKHMS